MSRLNSNDDKSHSSSSDGSGRREDSLKQSPSVEEICDWLVAQIAAELGADARQVNVKKPFAQYGLDSVAAVSLIADLEDWLGRELEPTLVWDYPNVESLARFLAGETDARTSPSRAEADGNVEREPIAIIGIGCRFPGEANSPAEFWRLLRNGVDAITEVPRGRFDAADFYDPNPAVPGKMNTRWGGFLNNVDGFDPLFFGISPREAMRLDPQQRMLLEVAWEALEDGGQVPERLAGTPTGVFVGIWGSEYGSEQLSDPDDIDVYVVTGSALSIAANRLSYFFDFRGPSIALDTACSSSLVAVDLACRSLWSGQSTLALAGGANLILSPSVTINFSQGMATSPDGRCRAFDAKANGMVRSEGVGLVVLKPLSRALLDGDPIYALIRGSAVNQDGRTNGIAAPNQASQEAVLRDAYRAAGVSPSQVSYVDAHGTGTLLGDPIEVKALGKVLAEGRDGGDTCSIGSVKSNIGHLEAAAGVAGLIKVALSLKHGEIPPSIHFQEPNPHIPFAELPLRVQQTLTPWPETSAPAVAGVSAFGFGGTNAHVVLQAPPRESLKAASHLEEQDEDYPRLLPLSAHDAKTLRAVASAYERFLSDNGPASSTSLRDVCFTAGARRTHHQHRLPLLFDSRSHLLEQLRDLSRDDSVLSSPAARPPRLAFVFSGQGLDSFSLAPELIHGDTPFGDAVRECDRLLLPLLGFSVIEALTGEGESLGGARTDVTQAALFAVQVGLVAWWRSWGVEPSAVVGHSVGEVAAAYAAGALSLEEAARVVAGRATLMQRELGRAGAGRGAMAAVRLGAEEALRAAGAWGNLVVLAAENGPESVVLSGEAGAVEELLRSLKQRGVSARLLPVPGAGHSQQAEPLREALESNLQGLEPSDGRVPIYSTVGGRRRDGREFDAAYWGQNVCQPVRFWTAVDAMLGDGYDAFVELSPHPLLTSAVAQGLRKRGVEGAAVGSLRRGTNERDSMASAAAALYARGRELDWRGVYGGEGRCVELPAYPWQRERFWAGDKTGNGDSKPRKKTARSSAGTAESHPLLGQHLQSSVHTDTHFWEMEISTGLFPYLRDHRVHDAVLLPAAAYTEMVLAALVENFGPGPHVLEQVEFARALPLPESVTQRVQLVLSHDSPGEASFKFLSLQLGGSAAEQRASWTLHSSGRVRLRQSGGAEASHDAPDVIQSRCQEVLTGAQHYQSMEDHGGHTCGPSFQCVRRVWRRPGEAIGELGLTEAASTVAGAFQIHPGLLDSCFQVMAATLPLGDERIPVGEGYLLVGMEGLRFYGRPPLEGKLWSHALLKSDIEKSVERVEGDVTLLDEEGRVVLEVTGLTFQHLPGNAQQQKVEQWLYQVRWEPKPATESERDGHASPANEPGRWLVFTDGVGVGEKLLTMLRARGDDVTTVSHGETYAERAAGRYELDASRPEDFRQLFRDAFAHDQPPCKGVVYLWGLETPARDEITAESLEAAHQRSCGGLLHAVQALAQTGWRDAPRLWLLTSGVNVVGTEAETVSFAQSPLWGMGRTVANEHPEHRCTNVDLSGARTDEEIKAFFGELILDGPEDQIALRGDAAYVARLTRMSSTKDERDTPPAPPNRRRVTAGGSDPFRLEASTPGILDGLTLRPTRRVTPGPGEVEIEVHAAGLNFVDVLRAMGSAPGLYEGEVLLGADCAGKISALGEGVEGLALGDEVVSIAPSSFGTYATTKASLVLLKPSSLSFEEAATIPVAFATAYVALAQAGRLSKGERVLIHAAAGGVGLAAVQIARAAGAEIFATAGSEEKRAFLRSLGVEHVMDSRSLAFADDVMSLTGGRGVDVVLNCLTDEAMAKGLTILAPFGRFLEIGKRDIYRKGMLPLECFRKNLSYSAIDLGLMAVERPAFVGELLRELFQLIEDGIFRPLPLRVFPISDVTSAFRFMAQAKHIGKIVVSLKDEDVWVVPQAESATTFSPDATYLITGGMGDLGSTVARWMVERGARQLVLLGRSEPSAARRELIDSLERAGASVVVARADVSRREQLAEVVSLIERTMHPLKGVVHCAGTIDDGLILKLAAENFPRVMAPKVGGAWNLHALTAHLPLDFFVMFSSAASLLGSPGQANYAAANAFLDALAHHRRGAGLPALSINWGPWAEIGGAAQANRGGRLAFRGVGSISPAQGVEALEQLLRQGDAQVGVVPLNLRQLHQFYPKRAESPLFARLAREEGDFSTSGGASAGESPLRKELLAVGLQPRQSMLERHLQEQIGHVLGLSSTQINRHTSLGNVGLDSLMALELRNRLEASLGLELSPTLIWNYPTIAALAKHLATQLGPEPPTESPAHVAQTPKSNGGPHGSPANLEQLTEEELAALLAREIDAVQERESK